MLYGRKQYKIKYLFASFVRLRVVEVPPRVSAIGDRRNGIPAYIKSAQRYCILPFSTTIVRIFFFILLFLLLFSFLIRI